MVPKISEEWTYYLLNSENITIMTPPKFPNIRAWLMIVYYPENMPNKDIRSPMTANRTIFLNICHCINSLHLKLLSKYVWKPATTARKGIILVYLQDSFKKGVFRGKWTWNGIDAAADSTDIIIKKRPIRVRYFCLFLLFKMSWS